MAALCHQQPTPSPEQTGHGLQSIRLSCERCRFQKLKCTVPAGYDGRGPCRRCVRAKVECIFGRRRQTNRIGKLRRPSEIASSIETSQESPVTSMSSSGPPCPTLADPNIQPSLESTMFGMQSWNNFPLQNVVGKATEFTNAINGYELTHGNGLEDVFLLDTDLSDSTQYSPTGQPQSQPIEDINSRSDNSSLVQQLLALLSEMEQRLRLLKEKLWQFGSPRGLDDYPIGTILYLSHQFSTIVDRILRGDNEVFNGNMSVSSSSFHNTTIDMLTTLLLLSGYTSLMRIYNIVLGHFQTHLSQIPSPGQSLVNSPTNPTLQLGELSCANTAYGLGRIHTALCMLQDSLNGIEGQMGRGDVIPKDMSMNLLKNEAILSSGSFHDEISRLNRQATAVKGLLREKMSL